jgi:glycosyltransferase involved in cell wall biosynthesis
LLVRGRPDVSSGGSTRLAAPSSRGPIDDDEVLYRRARCFVDVGVGGSGTKVKVLNALARGLPVVTGPDGAAGLEVSSGEHLLVAEDREAMVASLEFVIQEDAAWTNLSRSGRDLVRRRYVPEVAFGALDAALAGVRRSRVRASASGRRYVGHSTGSSVLGGGI